jgi:hypothetical protein
VNGHQLERLLRLVSRTEDEELSCTACFALLPSYVDAEVAGTNPEARLPSLRQHLDQCAVCCEEHQTLLELVRLEAEGDPPLQ